MKKSDSCFSLPRRTILGVALAATAISATTLTPDAGAADLASKKVDLEAFDRIKTDLPADIEVVIGKTHSIHLKAASDVLPKLSARVSQGRLTLEASGSFQTQQPIIVKIVTRALAGLEVGGAATLTLKALRNSLLEVKASGSSDVTLTGLNLKSLASDIQDSSTLAMSGKVTKQKVKVNDAASYHASGLLSDSANLRVGGSGDAVVHASRELKVIVEDAGSVQYLGDPALTKEVVDAGSLDKHEQ